MIGFDFETHIIAPARQLPRAVCMSLAEFDGATIHRTDILTGLDGVEYLFAALRGGHSLTGANTAFDVLVSIVNAGKHAKELLRLWVDAYESGRVHCIAVRQKLLDLAAGRLRLEEVRPGFWLHHRYNAAAIVARHSSMQLDKESYWRLNFAELEHLHPREYPAEAREYSLGDSIGAAVAHHGQDLAQYDERITAVFGSLPVFGAEETRQTMACIPLKSMSAYGLRTEAAAVDRLEVDVSEMWVEHRVELEELGLVRREDSRDTKAIAARLATRGLDNARKDTLLNSGDPWLVQLTHWGDYARERKLAEEQGRKVAPAWREWSDALAKSGLVQVKYTKDTKSARARMVSAYEALGRNPPLTQSKSKATPKPPPQVALDVDACEKSEDPALITYSAYTSLAKTLTADIPMLRRGAALPIHPRFEELLETGRTSASDPNTQNVRRIPGIRECFMPRPGFVFVDSDFKMLELHTLAQVCYWVLGYSHLGDALRAGKDPHLMIAATIMGEEYESLLPRKKEDAVDNARTAGKGVNFGAAGGLGPDTFAQFAWKSYRIKLTREQAKHLIDQYKATWTEMRAYFRWINSLEVGGAYNIVQPWSGRLRAGASYCSACNQPFQGLGSDVAKLAMWLVWKASMGLSELGEADPLFGCHPVNFVHDSIMTEVPEHCIDTAAARQSELMSQAARTILTDVPCGVDTLVTRQWSKKAQSITGPDGKLIPWDLRVACSAALEGALAKGARDPNECFAVLTSDKWPRDVSREVIAEHFAGYKKAS